MVQPTKAICVRAVELLMDRIKGKESGPGRKILFSASLSVGHSCGEKLPIASVVNGTVEQGNSLESQKVGQLTNLVS
jgi:hypothetical protein